LDLGALEQVPFHFCAKTRYTFRPAARLSSEPYISGDTFRAHADFLFDETTHQLHPKMVHAGDVIFVQVDKLGTFFGHIHPHIRYPYVLVSHNGDLSTPHPFAKYLDDPKLLAWFGQNVEDYQHPKLISIPIGIRNHHLSLEVKGLVDIYTAQKNEMERDHLLYLNFAVETHVPERSLVLKLFKDMPFCFATGRKNYQDYLIDLVHSKFVLSPRGYGVDCFRTWEALYMGAIPIVKTSALDPLYEGLPVLIVNDWTEITEEFLHEKWEEMNRKEYHLEKLYADYWLALIASYKHNY
jgi:hypothetical protein